MTRLSERAERGNTCDGGPLTRGCVQYFSEQRSCCRCSLEWERTEEVGATEENSGEGASNVTHGGKMENVFLELMLLFVCCFCWVLLFFGRENQSEHTWTVLYNNKHLYDGFRNWLQTSQVVPHQTGKPFVMEFQTLLPQSWNKKSVFQRVVDVLCFLIKKKCSFTSLLLTYLCRTKLGKAQADSE